jgi:maleate isomerase
VTTSTAALEALRTLGVERLTVLTPYPTRMTEIVGQFLRDNGFEVLSLAGRAHPDNLEIGNESPDSIAEFAREHVAEDADGIFCSCTNWRSMAAVEAIEAATGKPVVTSNQATIWAAYRRLGISDPIEGYGRLMRQM